MTYAHDTYNYIIKLSKGELLVTSLEQFAREAELKSGWIMGLGGVQWAELGFYDLEKREYQWQKFDQLLELTSLQGNLAQTGDGTLKFHLHGTFSDSRMQAIGGHIKEAEIAATCELFVHRWFKDSLVRKIDKTVGLPLLDLDG